MGKRGSGKSFTLGVIAEGLAVNGETVLAHNQQPRAVLLFDPLDVYWTTRYGVAPTDNGEAERHYELARSVGLGQATFNVEAWIPGAANRRPADPAWFQTFELPVPHLGFEEWELVLGVNIMSEPIGQAFADVLARSATPDFIVEASSFLRLRRSTCKISPTQSRPMSSKAFIIEKLSVRCDSASPLSDLRVSSRPQGPASRISWLQAG